MNIEHVAISRLRIADENPRSTDSIQQDDIETLAESIDAVGLIQNLTGYWDGEHMMIVAGGRRVRALIFLADESNPCPITEDDTVPVKLIDKKNAKAVGLAENKVRKGIDLIDEIIGFWEMSKQGYPVESIARAFGVSISYVKATVAIGSLPEPIKDALRADKITLEHAKAYTLGRSKAQIVETFNAMMAKEHDWMRGPRSIRDAMTDGKLRTDDPRAVFIGAEEYEKAGGAFIEDLFHDNNFILDVNILNDLVDAKMAQIEADLHAEGWGFVVMEPDGNTWDLNNRFDILPGASALSEDEADEINALEEAADERDLTDDEGIRYDQLQDKAQMQVYSKEQMKDRGCHVCLARNGEPTITTGLSVKGSKAPDGKPVEDEPKPIYSHSMTEDLRWSMSNAMAASLAKKAELAMDLLAYELAGSLWGGATMVSAPASDHGRPGKEDQVFYPPFVEVLTEPDSFIQFRKKGKAYRNKILAARIANSLRSFSPKDETMMALVAALGFDMRKHWTPDETFFKRMTMPGLIVVWDELADVPFEDSIKAAKLKMPKKSEMVKMLTDAFADPKKAKGLKTELIERWLPEPLRPLPVEAS